MSGQLSGRVALVTGAGRGLGRAYALRLARAGASVVVNDLTMHTAQEYGEELTAPTVPDEIRKMGGSAIGIEADVTDRRQVDAMMEQAAERFGRIDILVTNAGGALVSGPSYATQVPEADFRKMVDINFWGTVNCCQAVAAGMKDRRYGKIVTVGSQAGLRDSAESHGGGTAYSVAKAAIHQYTRKLSSELGPFNVTVNCIAPGLILSSRAIAGGRGTPESRARLEPMTALHRLGEPEECAGVVEFLVSDMSSYVTGQIIPICGGICLF